METVSIYLTSMSLGGAQRIARNLCSGLVNKGYDVELVLVEARGELLAELPDAVSVVDLGEHRVATSIFPLSRYLRRRQPDVLYAMMTEINVASVLAHRLAQVDTRLIISEHNTLTASSTSIKDKLIIRLAGHTYSLADHIITVSEGVRSDLLEIVDLPADAVSVVYNPIDVEGIREQAQEKLDHEWFHDDSKDIVLSAGRHVPQKGFDTLMRAFACLDTSGVRLVLLGQGPETESLQALAETLGITAEVDITGYVDNPFKYMANADVFVLSSWYEGFGNVLIESMATGCPVVSTDCPSGPSEILENGKHGPLVPIKNPERMAEAIDEVLTSPPKRSALMRRADEFSVGRITERYEEIFFET
jgi:glycosyltransferase involved in cell wall biosynthesis